MTETNPSYETTEASADQQIKALTAQLAEATAKANELEAKAAANWDQALRAKAEMENIRRRGQKDLENAHKFALDRFVQELIPVVDSMELGLAAIDRDAQDVAKFREGSELTVKMLLSALEKFHVKQLNPKGQKFNPDQQQAISALASGELEPNTVIDVVQKGYLLNDRLVRPALVVVSKGGAGASSGTPASGSSVDETV